VPVLLYDYWMYLHYVIILILSVYEQSFLISILSRHATVWLVYEAILIVKERHVMQGLSMSFYFLQVDVTLINALYSWLRWQVAPVMQCSKTSLWCLHTLLRTELECRDIYVWSAKVLFIGRWAWRRTVTFGHLFLRGLGLNWVFNVNGAFCIMA